MTFKNILCNIGKHEYRSVLRTYDVFSTRWTDTGGKDYWTAHFLECKRCKKRSFVSNYRYSSDPHEGLDRAKHRWLEDGHISDAIKNYHKYNKPETPKSEPESIINGLTLDTKIAKMLMKALDTSSESEAQTCLKMARKAYKNAESNIS